MYFKLSKPKQSTFVISLIVAFVALLLGLFWVMAVAYLILALGNLLRGL